jgi:hypothetical protein
VSDEDEEMLGEDDGENVVIKNTEQINKRIEQFIGKVSNPNEKDPVIKANNMLLKKMKYMLDCGFNLLVYGVGSKMDVLNFFAQKHLQTSNTVLVFNGYHTGCNMKIIVDEIANWFIKEIYKNNGDKKQLFPRNVGMHEQITNIKRQFTLLQKKGGEDLDEVILGETLYILIHSMDAGSLKNEEC